MQFKIQRLEFYKHFKIFKVLESIWRLNKKVYKNRFLL